MTHMIDHLGIAVKSLAQARKFYENSASKLFQKKWWSMRR